MRLWSQDKLKEFVQRLEEAGFTLGELSSDGKRPILVKVGEVGPDACFVYHKDDRGHTLVVRVFEIIEGMRRDGVTVSLSSLTDLRMLLPTGSNAG